MLGIVIVNYRTPELTLACVRSVVAAAEPAATRVVVVDNAAASSLEAPLAALAGPLRAELLVAGGNTGFAAASNRGLRHLLQDPAIDWLLLLNSDATLEPGGLAQFLTCAHAANADMVAARMHRMDAPEAVESLGIALYASTLASNRMHLADRLLGPTGGLALYSRRLVADLVTAHGHFFDERFFCYAEDTDVALRALWRGFAPAWCDARVALHRGQASSGPQGEDFILYHGIRNSIWTMWQNLPLSALFALAPLALALHLGIIARHLRRGRGRVLVCLYRDAWRGLPQALATRRVIRASRKAGAAALWRRLTPRFYERGYLRRAWRELWRGG